MGKRGKTGEHLRGRYGPQSNGWRGGNYIAPDGYVYIWVGKDHPMSTVRGYVPEHRLVMARMLERPLLSHEIVHHKDGIKTHNTPDNLVLTTRAAHLEEHRDDICALRGYTYPMPTPLALCAGCGIIFQLSRPPRKKRSFHSRECFKQYQRQEMFKKTR